MSDMIQTPDLWIPPRYSRTGLWSGPREFSRRRCCCEGCIIFSDDFNRTDSSDIGSDWTEVSGDWSISSNQLSVNSSGAIIICQTTSTLPYVVQAKVTLNAIGERARVIVAYQDTDNYYFAEAHNQFGGGFFTLRLYKRAGGANTLLDTWSSLNCGSGVVSGTLRVCLNANYLRANLVCGVMVQGHVGSAGTYTAGSIGLGTGAGGATEFDDFNIHTVDRNNSDCPGCDVECTRCTNNSAPQGIQAVIAGVAGPGGPNCSDWNGTWICDNPVGGCFWQSPNVNTGNVCRESPLSSGIVRRVLIRISDPWSFCLGNPAGNELNVWLVCVSGSCADVECAHFRKWQVAKYDCINFDNYSVPPSPDAPALSECNVGCDVSGATCHLTAL